MLLIGCEVCHLLYAHEVFVSLLEGAKLVSFFGLMLAGVMLHLVSICVYCLGGLWCFILFRIE